MTLLPHLAARLFGVPLAIHRPKLDIILSVLGARIGHEMAAATTAKAADEGSPGTTMSRALSSGQPTTVIRLPPPSAGTRRSKRSTR